MTEGGNDIVVSNGPVLDLAGVPYHRPHKPREPVLPNKAKRIWLVSFTDFMSLMVAFFVMMYAMSDPQLQDYKKINESIQNQFQTVKPVKTQSYAGLPNKQGDVDTITLSRVKPESSLDAVYLQQVLENRRDERPALKPLMVQVVGRELEMAVPTATLFDGSSVRISDKSKDLLSEIAQFLNGLPNRVEVLVHTKETTDTAVVTALTRGQAVQNELRARGYLADMAILVNQGAKDSTFGFRITRFEGQGRR